MIHNHDPLQPSNPRPPRQLWAWITAAAIIVPLGLVGIIHVYLGHSAETRWTAAQKRLADTHHTLDYAALTPPPVPDDDNFFAIPALKNIAVEEADNEPAGAAAERRQRLEGLRINDQVNSSVYPADRSGLDYGQHWDAAAWANYYRAAKVLPMPPANGNPGRDIVRGMAAMQPLLDELKAGIGRKLSQVTPSWKDRPPPKLLMATPLPYLNPLQQTGRTLMYHARAAVAAGDPGLAVDDICTMIRLAEGLGHESTLMHSLVALTILQMAAEPAWMVLDQRTADEATLARLAQCLERIDIPAMVSTALRGELAIVAQTCDSLAGGSTSNLLYALRPLPLGSPPGIKERIDDIMSYIMIAINPSAGVTGNKAVITDLMLTHILTPFETGGLPALRKSTGKITSAEDMRHLAPGVFGLMARYCMTGYHGIADRALMVQARINQARIACALDRHFIKHQSYPDDLKSLVPDYQPAVPLDPIDGYPMHYQKTGARYKIWSLGFDNDDDGGIVKPGPKSKNNPLSPKLKAADYPGDWVWSYEPLLPEPPPEPKPRPGQRRVIIPPAAPSN